MVTHNTLVSLIFDNESLLYTLSYFSFFHYFYLLFAYLFLFLFILLLLILLLFYSYFYLIKNYFYLYLALVVKPFQAVYLPVYLLYLPPKAFQVPWDTSIITIFSPGTFWRITGGQKRSFRPFIRAPRLGAIVCWCLSKIRGESSRTTEVGMLSGYSEGFIRGGDNRRTWRGVQEDWRDKSPIPIQRTNGLSHQQNDLRFMVAASRFAASVFPGLEWRLSENNSHAGLFERREIQSGSL